MSVHTVEVLRGRDGVRGPPGPHGVPGIPGPQGERGVTGDKGERGLQGETGIMGPQGIVGLKGTTGDKGDHGDTGLPGPQGPTIGGAVYVRWGRTVCPSGQGTELVYSGRAGGSHHSHSGGGAKTISVCQMILNTCSILVEYKEIATYMEWNIDLILNHYKGLITTMFPVQCVMSQHESHC